MRVGLSSASFYPEVYTENSIARMKKLGFDCGEIFLNSSSEYEEGFVKELKGKVEESKFDIISVHSFSSSFEPYLFDRYERRRKDFMKSFERVCKAGAALGASFYTFHGLRLMDYKSININEVVDIYNQLTYTACENGVKLSQENVSWCMSGDINFLSSLKEKVKYPLSFTLDIKQAYKAEVMPKAYIDVMGSNLENVHINDRDDKNLCLLPGRGSVDYQELLSDLRRIGYKGDFIIEVYRENFVEDDDLTQCKRFLDKLINF